jgi:hypothetical protein
LAIGGIFAPLGGLCAGIITYSEYASHRLPKGRALQEALRSGLLATGVLVTLTGAFGWLVDRSR